MRNRFESCGVQKKGRAKQLLENKFGKLKANYLTVELIKDDGIVFSRRGKRNGTNEQFFS